MQVRRASGTPEVGSDALSATGRLNAQVELRSTSKGCAVRAQTRGRRSHGSVATGPQHYPRWPSPGLPPGLTIAIMCTASALGDSGSSAIHGEGDVVLGDGGTVHVRALRADDNARLTRLFEQLSDEAVYFRFLSPMRRSRAEPLELHRLDGTNHVGLVALVGDEIVAVARYDRISTTDAEVALEVADAQHGRGIGTLLLQQLAAVARTHGIRTLSAVALPANALLFKMLADTGWPLERHFDAGVVRLRVPIDRSPGPSQASC